MVTCCTLLWLISGMVCKSLFSFLLVPWFFEETLAKFPRADRVQCLLAGCGQGVAGPTRITGICRRQLFELGDRLGFMVRGQPPDAVCEILLRFGVVRNVWKDVRTLMKILFKRTYCKVGVCAFGLPSKNQQQPERRSNKISTPLTTYG